MLISTAVDGTFRDILNLFLGWGDKALIFHVNCLLADKSHEKESLDCFFKPV